ncbi:MAG: GNAT family N-acetyltransferase [Clostridia bacterium]|nr:GNAT family N-acetyltransferase [Clostridia bacterium]
MIIEKAGAGDIERIGAIYEAIHDEEAAGRSSIGWIRGIYPTADTARAALARGDLYVGRAEGSVVAAAIINRIQPDGYEAGNWAVEATADEVLVLHTLVVDPAKSGQGLGRAFVDFYEQMARENGDRALRMDTNARNARARTLYAYLGYREVGTVPTEFNGIPDVRLVLLEKRVDAPGRGESPAVHTSD